VQSLDRHTFDKVGMRVRRKYKVHLPRVVSVVSKIHGEEFGLYPNNAAILHLQDVVRTRLLRQDDLANAKCQQILLEPLPELGLRLQGNWFSCACFSHASLQLLITRGHLQKTHLQI